MLHKNAKIWAESEGEGKGCTFFVHVPVHSHRALDLTLTQSYGGHSLDPRDPMNSSLIAPVHEYAHIDLTPKSCQIAAEAVCLIQSLNDNSHLEKRLSPRLPLVAPVVPVWKPTILVVDDSSMNRKVDAYMSHLFYLIPLPPSLTHTTPPAIQQMLVRSLVSRGFACCEAEDGLEALSEMSRSSNQFSLSVGVSCPSNVSSPRFATASASAGGEGGGGASSKVAGGGGVVVGGSPRSRRNKYVARNLNGLALGANMFERRASMVQHYSIDAVLIDFNMPRMNGPDAIVQLRNMGFRGPIIGVSGGDEKTKKQFLEAGADNVIQKPAKTDVLVDILLTGLEMLVMFDETQQRKSTPLSTMNTDKDSNVRGIELIRQKHMDQLLKFLTEAKAKAQAKTRTVLIPVLTPSP